MSWWTMVRVNLTRTPLRTFLTALSLVLAFLLFGLLQPIRSMFNDGIEMQGDKRLIVTPKHSVADMLPVSLAARIGQVDNVETVAHMTWFGGTYQDPENFFPQFAVTAQEFLRVNSEIQLATAEMDAFLANRRAAIVGRDTADRFGWQAGDVISLIPNIWHNRDGSAWTFELVGIFDSTNESVLGNDGFYFGFPYFDEYRAFANGTVGTFVLEVGNSDDLLATASAIDAQFANSSSETRTQSGAEYTLSFARQLGDVGAMTTIILVAVLFTLVIVTGHAMARSVHERTAEMAVLRVLGFRSGTLALWLMVEFVFLSLGAAAVGLGLAHLIALQLEQFIPQISQLGGVAVDTRTAAQGLGLALLIGVSVTALPVARSVFKPIASALRVEF